MSLLWFSRRHMTAEEARRRFVNTVDEALMERIERQREYLKAAGVQVKAVRRVPAEPASRSECHDQSSGRARRPAALLEQ